jgi:3-methyladenine DNA glycosylase AlkD
MTLAAALKRLEALGDEKMRVQNARHGAGPRQFGVKRGDLRKVAAQIKTDHALALALWRSGNIDAQFLATLVIDPARLSGEELEQMLRSAAWVQVTDWLLSYVITPHTAKEQLRRKWLKAKHPMLARAAWRLTADRVEEDTAGLDIPALLDRIEAEMGAAVPEAQWTMNCTLAQVGIRFAEYRARAVGIGESLGLYRDYPVSKGCTSPFAPIWIDAMVRRRT